MPKSVGQKERGRGSGENEVAKTDQSQATLRRERQCDETVTANGHQLAGKDKKKLAEQEKGQEEKNGKGAGNAEYRQRHYAEENEKNDAPLQKKLLPMVPITWVVKVVDQTAAITASPSSVLAHEPRIQASCGARRQCCGKY